MAAVAAKAANAEFQVATIRLGGISPGLLRGPAYFLTGAGTFTRRLRSVDPLGRVA